jgi:DNA polymerase-3 subunit delta'
VRFADVIGHGAAVARLRRAAAGDRPATAYLLSGPPGIGKRRVADAFTLELLCATPAPDGACGTCAQCVRVAAGMHPDVLVMVRDADRRDIRTEQVRELTRWLVLRPLMARRKVALVDGAETLNEHGQNALLKTLEEPPGAAVLVLTATRASQLLPTVRSRCQHVRLDPLANDEMARFLEREGVGREQLAVLIARAGGSPGRALGLRDDPQPAQRAALLDRLGRLPELAAADLSALAQTLARADLEPTLEVLTSWYRDLLGAVTGAEAPCRNPDAAPSLRAAAARTALPAVLRQLRAVCNTVDSLERNANRALAFETLLLALRRIERDPARADPWTSSH